MTRKINYLSNRELLAEIHKSKLSYCYFIDDNSKDYDIILKDVKDINEKNIKLAINNKINRLNYLQKEKSKRLNETFEEITEKDIDRLSLIFRVQTYEHIPIDEKRAAKKTKKIADKHQKLNFKPFKHYKLDEDNNPFEVGRSHWKNGLHNGEFCLEHGQITNKLASQFLLLVERYSQKGNWRNYTYLEDMKGQALVQLIGSALKFDEAVSDNPFSYLTMCCLNTFRGVLNTEKKISEIRNKIMMENGYEASFEKQAEYDTNNGDS